MYQEGCSDYMCGHIIIIRNYEDRRQMKHEYQGHVEKDEELTKKIKYSGISILTPDPSLTNNIDIREARYRQRVQEQIDCLRGADVFAVRPARNTKIGDFGNRHAF
jgi:hypothetical protein